MPQVTVLNPTDASVAGAGGPYPAFSSKGVNITGAQAIQLIQNFGLIVMKTAPSAKDAARGAFCLLAGLASGYSTPSQREVTRLKAGQQEYQALLQLLRSID